jgi:predicted Zn-dependent protease
MNVLEFESDKSRPTDLKTFLLFKVYQMTNALYLLVVCDRRFFNPLGIFFKTKAVPFVGLQFSSHTRLAMNKIAKLTFIGVAVILLLCSGAITPCHSQIFSSAEDDKKTGAEVAKQVEEQIGIYQAPLATEYVQAIGQRLIGNLEQREFDFRFQLVDQFEPNAFAAPGGYVYVSRGLLALANSEDELAGVIGHEIIHVTKRHSAKQSRRGILPSLLLIPGAIVSGLVSEELGALINTPLAAIGQVRLASYSRGQESEADRLGMRLSANSGYDPKSLATILAQLEKDVEMLTGDKHKASFFDSHPTTPKRVEEINKELAKIQWSPQPAIAKSQQDFLRRLEGLHYDENPAQGVFRGQTFLQPDLNFAITFPEKWKTTNTPSAVGAMTEKQEAMIFLGLADKQAEPEQLGQAFVAKLRQQYATEPSEARTVQAGQWPGYLVTLAESERGQITYMHILWVKMQKLTYQLIGVGGDRYRPTLKQTALSLRLLTEKERSSITCLRLRIVEAKAGETLAKLGQRTGNAWKPDYTAMINNIPADRKLQAGELIKIARRELYVPKKGA